MTSSSNAIDWGQLKPRILQDLANGKTQQQIRQGLAEDPFRVSISKSQLETQVKRWKYRKGLHKSEWKNVIHRINKRQNEGKASQVLVNGIIFNEEKVARAIRTYGPTTLERIQPPPQIPPNLSHHLIEIRTPPSSHRSLQLPLLGVMAPTRWESLAPQLTSAGSVWPRTVQWSKVELSVRQFVARVFLPIYEQDKKFRDAFNALGHALSVWRINRGQQTPPSPAGHEKSLTAQAGATSTDPQDGVPVDRHEIRRPFGGSHIHAAVVQTLLSLLYGLSNQSLGHTGRKALAIIMAAPAWDTVLPHLKDVLAVIDSKIVAAIAEGLFQESIHQCSHNMLDLSLGLGADPTQRIRCFDQYNRRDFFCAPLDAICHQYIQRSVPGAWIDSPERLIVSLRKREPHVSDSALLWIIGAKCHAIAEGVIRSQPHRVIDFSIAVSDLGGAIRSNLRFFSPLTPLVVACSGRRQSAERLSLVRCLLDRGARADLKAMTAAAQGLDGEVISLLAEHGAPVAGFIPHIGSPLSRACDEAHPPPLDKTAATAILLLLKLGASVDNPKTQGIARRDFSPLHLLASSEERPEVTQALDLLLKRGFDINDRSCLNMTALQCAIISSRWISAVRLLRADCELTGGELFLFLSSKLYRVQLPRELEPETVKEFVGVLLARAPDQAIAISSNGFTALQMAIQTQHEDTIAALFQSGITPTPSDFLYMFRNGTEGRSRVCPFSSSIQIKLAVTARLSDHPITDNPTMRLILAFACPGVVRHILHGCPDFYDSEGLCFLIARLVSKDRVFYSDFPDQAYEDVKDQRPDSLTVDDLHAFVSRRTLFNQDQDCENTAVTMAARAGRADVLGILIESNQEEFRSSGMIPSFLLKKWLIGDLEMAEPLSLSKLANELDWGLLGLWIKYCRMDSPNMRCSPLTAAVMIVSETAAEEVFDLLLDLDYQPDCWTVLAASSQGRLSILQRLKRLECWPHIANHKDRPDWCPTALQTAVYNAHVSTVRFLLDTAAMVNTLDLSPCRPFCFSLPETLDSWDSKTMLPRTALQHAVEKENMEMVILLINAGADVNAPAAMDSGATALQIASIQGSIPMVQYLISQGANPHAAGAAKHGRTAFEGAAERGHKDVIELLLGHDALTGYWHRKQLVKANSYAKQNAHHVVTGILRERMLPPWSSEDEEIFEWLEEDWENSAFDELKDKFDAWEEVFEDWPETLQAHETTSNSHVTIEQCVIKNPLAFQENNSWFLQDMEFGIAGHEQLDIGQISEIELYDGDLVSELALPEDTAVWVEGQPSLEGDVVDNMRLDDLSFSSST